MSSASEMWLSAENTSVPAGRPVSTSAPGRRSFGAPTPSLGYVRVFEPAMRCLPCRFPGSYFDFVAMVNGALPTCYDVVQTAALTVERMLHDQLHLRLRRGRVRRWWSDRSTGSGRRRGECA